MEITEEEKLDPEFKAKWLKALRSGEYKQGKGYLLDKNNKYCCLGVAGVLCGIPNENMENRGYLLQSLIVSFLVPKILQGDTDNKIISILSHMNDGSQHNKWNPEGKKFTFLEIADWIEENL